MFQCYILSCLYWCSIVIMAILTLIINLGDCIVSEKYYVIGERFHGIFLLLKMCIVWEWEGKKLISKGIFLCNQPVYNWKKILNLTNSNLGKVDVLYSCVSCYFILRWIKCYLRRNSFPFLFQNFHQHLQKQRQLS